jgi:prefoldin subunit 5
MNRGRLVILLGLLLATAAGLVVYFSAIPRDGAGPSGTGPSSASSSLPGEESSPLSETFAPNTSARLDSRPQPLGESKVDGLGFEARSDARPGSLEEAKNALDAAHARFREATDELSTAEKELEDLEREIDAVERFVDDLQERGEDPARYAEEGMERLGPVIERYEARLQKVEAADDRLEEAEAEMERARAEVERYSTGSVTPLPVSSSDPSPTRP